MHGFRVELIERLPEPEGPVANGQGRTHLQTPLLEIAQDIEPGFGGLPQPVADGHPLLGASGGDPDDDQQTKLGIVALAQRRVDAVDPPVGVFLAREAAPRPALVLLSLHWALSRPRAAGESPLAPSPTSTSRASPRSPLEIPLR
jgi:hypothetical protein